MTETLHQVTLLLGRVAGGDREAVDHLLPLVYKELRRLAQYQLGRERFGHTLNATALVHEAYLKLIDQRDVAWQNRAHFVAIAAQAMRRILIDYARRRLADKRGGDVAVITYDEALHARAARAEELVDLDQALEQLRQRNERQALIVEYQFFGGLTHDEIAEVLKVSVVTVRRDWRTAKAWLTIALGAKGSSEE